MCYAGDRTVSAAFVHRTAGTGHHEDRPVPALGGQRLGSAGAAAGAAPLPMGRAVREGEKTKRFHAWTERRKSVAADETGGEKFWEGKVAPRSPAAQS